MRVVTAIALAGALLTTTACDRAPATPADVGRVVDVIDGDTVDIDIAGHEERVRLLGIDTPEVFLADGAPPECFGPESSAFTADLLTDGARVRLERDVVGRDDYGRLLAYVFVLDAGEVTGGSLVNEAIVRQGYARPLIIAPNGAYATRLVAAATAAEAEGLGLWGGCDG